MGSSISVTIEEDVIAAVIHNGASLFDIGGDIIAPIVASFNTDGPSNVRVGGNVRCHRFYTEKPSIHIEGNLDINYYETDYFDYIEDEQGRELTKGDNSLFLEGEESENPIMFYVGGEITVEDNITINNSKAFINSMNTKNGHIKIDDDSILLMLLTKIQMSFQVTFRTTTKPLPYNAKRFNS